MVSDKLIRASNALIDDASVLRVSVFVGGTSGIGKLTIKAIVDTQTSVRIYIVGRPSARERTMATITQLQQSNSKAELIWVEAEIASLADTKRVCRYLLEKETQIDLLFMSAGYAPFGARRETTEKIEIAQSLEYYSRVLFILHLLPALGSAKHARVVSVLGGGLEKLSSLNLDDMDLRQPGNFSGVKAQGQYICLNTLALDYLADENPGITFIHAWPGMVNTGNVKRSFEPNSFMGWVSWLFLEPLIAVLSTRDEVVAQRYLFTCTSARYGRRGSPWGGETGVNARGTAENGLFLVNYACDCTPNQQVIPSMRAQARDKVWQHTQDVLQLYM